jgi:peptidoglycan/LPS O-acetylase OafA/YrhL
MHKSRDAGIGALRHRPIRRGKDVEVLCGVAIVFVLVQHFQVALIGAPVSDQGPSLTYFSFWSGIDLLFAVVGFLGARELAPRLAAANGFGAKLRAAGGFWLRCAWCVLPTAWLWLAVAVICAIAFNRSGMFGAPATALHGALSPLLNVENIKIAFFAHGAPQGAMFPYWALSLAVQFCLVLPLVLLLCRPRLALVLAAAIFAQLVQTRAPGDALSFVRTDALLLGALIAVWAKDPTYRLFEPTGLTRSRLAGLAVPAFLLFLLAATSSAQLHLVPFTAGVVAVLAAVLAWLASYDGGYFLPDGFLLKRVLAWIGARALPIYLGHIPAFLAAREIWFRLDPASLSAQPPHQLRFLVTALVLVAGLSELNHRLVEAPLRRLGPFLGRRLRAATRTPATPSDLAQAGALRPNDAEAEVHGRS